MSAPHVWVAALAVAAGCSTSPPADPPTTSLRLEIVRVLPHDSTAFTEGLEVVDGGLYESTGRVGASYLMLSDLHTREPRQRIDLDEHLFGEGIGIAAGKLWQITWRDGVAIERDPATLTEKRRVRYDGEGWGLCGRGEQLVMSDGSASLTFRDPITFDATGTVELTEHPNARLNELDCADDGFVYANDWPTSTILRIDPESGQVATIDARGLLDNVQITEEQLGRLDVLNGIAHLPGTDHFLITGKYWPVLFEVRFVR